MPKLSAFFYKLPRSRCLPAIKKKLSKTLMNIVSRSRTHFCAVKSGFHKAQSSLAASHQCMHPLVPQGLEYLGNVCNFKRHSYRLLSLPFPMTRVKLDKMSTGTDGGRKGPQEATPGHCCTGPCYRSDPKSEGRRYLDILRHARAILDQWS